jgi:hypothetical protein
MSSNSRNVRRKAADFGRIYCGWVSGKVFIPLRPADAERRIERRRGLHRNRKKKAARYIARHYAEPLRVKKLAAITGLDVFPRRIAAPEEPHPRNQGKSIYFCIKAG